MIRLVEIDNFKCFQHFQCELSPLTVLAGLNGSGKSSLIQAILCTAAISERYSRDAVARLNLRGMRLDLGQARDVIFRFSESNRTGCKVVYDQGTLSWSFEYSTSDRDLEEIPVNFDAPLASITPRIRYLSANRLGPRTTRPYEEARARENDIGVNGESAASCLEYNGGMEVLPELRIKDELTSETTYGTLLEQTSAWLRKFTPTVFAVPRKSADGRMVELKYAFGDRKSEALYRAENVGIGLSIALPLIVLLLSSQKGDVVLVENPESDLHPKGQSQLAELMARAVKAGVQIVVETHSDHIINGLRVGVKKGILSPSDVNLQFFNRHTIDPEVHTQTAPEGVQPGWQVTTAETVLFEATGALSNYPSDLLRQMMIDADALMSFDEPEDGDESSAEF